MLIKIRHAVELGYCIKGIKEFCKQHNIDFKKFVVYGIEEEELLKTEDAMVIKVIEHAKKEVR